MSEADVFLPLLFKVQLHAYDPSATNDLGNEVEAWDDPVELDVYGWGPPQLQPAKEVLVGTTRYIVQVELMVPPHVFAKDNDRIQLASLQELTANPDGYEWYRVVGPTEDYSHNPFGWNPGNVINLVAVKGARI
jgi:hypothetical protein